MHPVDSSGPEIWSQSTVEWPAKIIAVETPGVEIWMRGDDQSENTGLMRSKYYRSKSRVATAFSSVAERGDGMTTVKLAMTSPHYSGGSIRKT